MEKRLPVLLGEPMCGPHVHVDWSRSLKRRCRDAEEQRAVPSKEKRPEV